MLTKSGIHTSEALERVRMWTRQPSLLEIIIDQGKLKNVAYFNRLVCLVQYLHMKLTVGFLWQKQDLTRKRRFSLQG